MTHMRSGMVASNDEPTVRFETAEQLYAYFVNNTERFATDGLVEDSGHLKVSSRVRAKYTSDSVLEAVKSEEDRRRERLEKNLAAARTREECHAQRSAAVRILANCSFYQ